MAIDWIYDTTYVSFGVEWNAAYKAVGKVTIQPVVYRWDRYNTADNSKFSETLRYEPNGSTGSWSNIGWGSGSGTRSVDSFNQRTYQRQASAYTVQMQIATDSGFGTAYDGYFHTIGEVTRTATYTVPALPPAFNTLSATRVSDNQVNLSWTAASGNIKAVCIERSVDGGSYSEVAVIWNASATSWQDNATSADHSYTYRARYHHEGAYGAYSNTVTVTMTPSAPQTISTAAIQGSTNVAVELGNASPVATSLEWQASTDGGQTWGASSTVSGSPVTSFTATGISGTAYIRVRNVNATGTSDWLVSEQVTTICPPAAPTLISPLGVLDMAGGSVTFTWRHNPLDGSSQTAAQLAYSTNGGSTWTTVTKSTEESHTISPIPWAAGTLVTWRVRTKGADANYGDWAQAVQFDVFTAPTLNITSPGATITGMPISLAATYSDMAGYSCQAATVSLTKDGRTLYSESATINGTSITSSLDVSEFLPENGETYTVVVTARSSSSLQTTANASFLVDFTEPVEGSLQVQNMPETGYVSLVASYDNTGADEPAVSISVARVNPDGTVTPLLTDGASGSGIVDRFAPLNTPYQYAVTTKASSQAVKTVYVDNIIESDYWFAYWGENIAKAKWNPENGGIQVTRPSKTRVYYAGRRDPVSYDGHAVALTETPSWMFIGKDEVDVFVRLIEDGGRGVYKSCDGWVYHADFDLTLTPSYTAIGYYGGASLGITRIAGDRL